MTPRSICLKAAKILSKKGLVKGEYFRHNYEQRVDTRYCAIGVLRKAGTGNANQTMPSWLNDAIFGVHTAVYGEPMSYFNDREETTRKDVINRLKELARLV